MLTLEKIGLSKISSLSLFAGMLFLQSSSAAMGRTQWEIDHPAQAPGQETNPTYGTPWPGGYGMSRQFLAPGQATAGQPIPGQWQGSGPVTFGKNFWQGGAANQIPTGSILKGVLESTISSAQSQAGSTFSIALPEGFTANGIQIVPQGTKLVGAVTAAAPAARLRHGQAGSLQVAIQSLVLPDGITVPFSGVIDSNPNHIFKEPPQKRFSGFDLADTGQQVAGMLGSFTNGSGYLLSKRQMGKDFLLEKGEVIPIRVTRAISLPFNPQVNAPTQSTQQPIPGLAEPPLGTQQSASPQLPAETAATPGLVDSAPIQSMPDPF